MDLHKDIGRTYLKKKKRIVWFTLALKVKVRIWMLAIREKKRAWLLKIIFDRANSVFLSFFSNLLYVLKAFHESSKQSAVALTNQTTGVVFWLNINYINVQDLKTENWTVLIWDTLVVFLMTGTTSDGSSFIYM